MRKRIQDEKAGSGRWIGFMPKKTDITTSSAEIAAIAGNGKRITLLQLQFCEEFLKCGIGREAYEKVYPKTVGKKSAVTGANKLNRKSNIKAYLDSRRKEIQQTVRDRTNNTFAARVRTAERVLARAEGKGDNNIVLKANDQLIKLGGWYAAEKMDVQSNAVSLVISGFDANKAVDIKATDDAA